MRDRRISPSLVLACVALVVAMAGTAVAAKRYIITNANQIKPSVARKLAGPTGVTSVTIVESEPVALQPGQFTAGGVRAYCPPGSVVVGTGFGASIGNADFVLSYGTFVGGFFYNDSSISIDDLKVQALCGSAGAQTLSSRSDSSFKDDVAAAVAAHEQG